jgi:hypothetical protein
MPWFKPSTYDVGVCYKSWDDFNQSGSWSGELLLLLAIPAVSICSSYVQASSVTMLFNFPVTTLDIINPGDGSIG